MTNQFKVKNGLIVDAGGAQITGSLNVSGSIIATDGITGSIAGTASFAETASFALTASYLDNYIPPFPFTGSAEITGSLQIDGNLTTNLTSGSIPFISASGLLTQDNSNLFWNNANKRLGIGTNAPVNTLHVAGSARFVFNTGFNSSITDGAIVLVNPNNTSAALGVTTDNFLRIKTGNGANIITGTVQTLFNRYGLSSIQAFNSDFGIFGNADVQKFRIFNTSGNVLIQNDGTFVNAGFRLDVNGTARVQGALTVTTGASITGTINHAGQYTNESNISWVRIPQVSHPGFARRIEIDQPNSRILLLQGNSDGVFTLTRENNSSTTTYNSTFGVGSTGDHNGRHRFQCNSVDVLSITGASGLILSDAININVGTATGSRIGTANNQLLSFWNATPIVQPINTTPINEVLTNTGLMASGSTSTTISNDLVVSGSLTVTGTIPNPFIAAYAGM